MAQSQRAGALNHWVQVLSLEETADGWAWAVTRGTWANLTLGTGRNLFSAVGIGARDCTLVVRAQALELSQAMRWGQQHIFLTSILPGDDRGHLVLHGALVETAECLANVHEEDGGQRFPGVLTEKYVRYEQPDPYAVNRLTYVLVTPKAVVLQRGGLVTVNGVNYEVQTAHTLDQWKNEYEVFRTDDL